MANLEKVSAKQKIIDTAFKLFLEQGYNNTTVNQIIKESETSRGAFYHHFEGKEEVLFSMAYYFDADYTNWLDSIDKDMPPLKKLLNLNYFIMENIENSPYRPLLAILYGLQVMTKGKRHIINPEREYYKIIRKILKEAIDKGDVKYGYTDINLAHWYAILERGLTFDWCLNQGSYSLIEHGQILISSFIDKIKK